jgi:hypothetical protein
LVATLVFAYLKAPEYINNNLSGWVAQKTRGTYRLQFDRINLSIVNWGFSAENVSLCPALPETGSTDSISTKKIFYSFSSPEVNVKNVGLFNLFVLKKLAIGKFEIREPDFRVDGTSGTEYRPERNINILFRELEPLLRKKLRSVRIKEIELIDANYNLYNFPGQMKKGPDTGQITIGIKNFYTDSLLLPDPDRLFNADDVFVRITDFQKELGDSLHVLRADEVYYSLTKAHITGQNVSLQPQKDTLGLKNQYIVKVPFLKLKSNFIHGFYTSDSIRIDSLLLDRAEIEFYPKHNSGKITLEHISGFDLYELIKDDFRSLNIRHFLLDNASLKLYNFKDGYFLQQEMKKAELELGNFYLDSASIDNTDKIFYSDSLSLAVEGYQVALGDRHHLLNIDKLSASTGDGSVRVYHARVGPVSEEAIKRDKKMAIQVDCDSMRIRDAKLKQAFHFRELPIGGMELYKPVITINRYDTEMEKTRRSPNLVYEMIASYFRGIYANIVVLENGQLQVSNLSDPERTGFIRSRIDFNLTGFALDSLSAARSDKLFFASDIDLTFSDYEMKLVDQLHRMTIDQINLSSSQRSASAERLHLYPVVRESTEALLQKYGNSELYEVNVPFLHFLNTDIHQAFFNKKLTIGNIRIMQPEISVESFANLRAKDGESPGIDEFYKLLSNYISDVDIRQIEAKDGELKLTRHDRKGKTIGFNNKFNLLLDRFRLNRDEIGKRKLLFSENIDLKIEKYLFRLSDQVHYLQAGEIGLSTFNSRVYAKDAVLYPDITNPGHKKLPWNIHITLPSVSLSGVDLLAIYFDGKLSAENFTISSPDIQLYKVNDEKRNFDFKEFTLLLPDEIRELTIRDFQMHGGKIQLLRETEAGHHQFMGGLIGMQTNNLKIETNRSAKSSRVTSGTFSTRMEKLWLEPIGKNQRIGLERIDYSTGSKKISIKNLSVAPKRTDATRNQYKLQVPEINLDAFDIDRAYTKNEYDFDRIVLSKPEFTFYKNINDSGRFNPYTFDLYPYFEDFADVFFTRQLSLEEASFRFQSKEKTIEQSGVDLNLSGFKVTKNNDNRFLSSDQFTFSFSNITRYDREKRYRFQFDRIGFSSTDNQFVVSGIQLKPQYSKERMLQIVGHQADYFEGRLQEIRFEKMELKRWFEKRELVGRRLLFKGLNMDVFRDKRVVFNQKQRPPMPQDLIRNFDLKFYFDSLELSDASVSYAEQIEESPKAGHVDFKNVNARLKPFTNIPYLTGIAGKSQLDVNGNLMGGPLMSAQIVFDMNSPENMFEVQGNIASCPMDIVNPMTKPAALMEINTGTLQRFDFQFTGNNEQARGKLRFAYDDLNISIYEVRNGFTRKSRFSSFMANSLLIKSKNPRGKILLPDDISYRRDPSRSILNFWWKSIFSGIKNTFGIKEKK